LTAILLNALSLLIAVVFQVQKKHEERYGLVLRLQKIEKKSS
jgi:hypothetical protein